MVVAGRSVVWATNDDDEQYCFVVALWQYSLPRARRSRTRDRQRVSAAPGQQFPISRSPWVGGR
jgi:hypothetical protein